MHLQDRKLFSFGDSIYHAMEMSEGFAIELNPLEMMDSILKIFAKGDNSPLIKNILGKKEFDKVAGRLEKKLQKSAGKITTKNITDDRNNWLNKYRRKDDMETFIDMYLYTIAQNQGKYVGGIEDIEDQIGLFDDVGSVDVEEYLKEDDKVRLEYLDRMKQVYITRDLNQLQEMTYGKSGNDFHDLVLVKRNIKMSRRMDSLAHLRNTFFAVGAAHLPGDSGIISLLRKRGFLVEPVNSSNYVKPEDYHYTIREAKWEKIEDNNKMCSVEMPGQPTTINISEVIPMHFFVDLSNIFCYGMAVVPTSGENEDTMLSKLVAGYKKQGFDIISTKKIEQNNVKGVEMKIKSEGYFLTFRMLIRGNKLFMLIFGAQDIEKLNAVQASKYFASLVINDTVLNRQTSWELVSDTTNAFSLVMPGRPIYKFNKGTKETVYDVYAYTATDFSDGSFYNITVQNTIPGYFIETDSIVFAGLKERFKGLTDSETIHVTDFVFNGYHGHKMVASKKHEGGEYLFQIYMITRGNRIYMPLVVSEKKNQNSKDISSFFKNFTFLPFQKPVWQRYQSPVNNFSTWSPTALELKKTDSTEEEDNKRSMYAFDKNSVITYGVEINPYSHLYWSNSDSVFYKNLADTYKTNEDSVVQYRLLQGDTMGLDILIKHNNSDSYKKLRTIFNGDTAYVLFTHIPKELADDKDVNLFFSGLTFTNPLPTTIFKNKQDALITALQSKDSVTRSNAEVALEQIDFSKKDISFLHQAWIRSYPGDKNKYKTINYTIGQKILALKDPGTIDFIDKNYAATNISDVQISMLQTLAELKTERSYATLKNLLLQHPPARGRIYSFSAALQDSLLLSAKLFPEVARLYADTIVGSTLIKLTDVLLDSNLVSPEIIKQNADMVYSLAKYQLGKLKADTDYYPEYNNYVINILRRLGTKQSIELLRNFLLASNSIKYDAVIALLKIDQPVSPLIINKLANDKGYRTGLYTSLKEIKKTNLFPKELYTQQKFAEAYVYDYVAEEEDDITIQPVGEKLYKTGGQLKRYYLFKVGWMEDYKKTEHLAVCGPFNLNTTLVDLKEEDAQINIEYEEKYTPASMQKSFLKLMRPADEGNRDAITK